jgi:uncharacterized protein (TIGR02271 family)
MTKTVIGTYSSLETATAVVNDLVNAGFHRNAISVIADDPDEKYAAYVDHDTAADGTAAGAGIGAVVGGLGGLLLGLGALAIPGIGPVIAAGPIVAALTGAGVGAVTGGIIGALVDMGIPEESAQAYAESVRRGNVLVTAQVADNRVDEASRIMQRTGLLDIERQTEDWRASGWKGFDANAAPLGTVANGQRTTKSTTVASGNRAGDTFQVVEENLQVGKRAVETGGVRVKSNVREVPVEEEVTLRQEHVEVERRPVDRPATAADLNAFKEGTIEVRETQEKPVVSKEARVVEEVSVRKNVEQHTEKVKDTVRRTEVDVEPIAGTGRTATTGSAPASTVTTSYETFDPDFRANYQTVYSGMGKYERFQPAYRYGYTLATDKRYQGRSWGDIEPEARKSWNSQHQNSWEDFKDAIQYAWDKVRGKV